MQDAISDEELESLALDADPTERLSADATPVPGSVAADDGPLPGWYMPTATNARPTRRRKIVTMVIIAAFLVINALGLCATYGFIEIA